MTSTNASLVLGDCCLLITKGTTPNASQGRFSTSGVTYIKSECLNYDGFLKLDAATFIDYSTHLTLKRSQIQAGDILYSIAGANLGKCCIAPASVIPANTNQAVAIIRVDDQKADPRFISYCLRDPRFVRKVLASVAQSAQPNVNLADIGRFELPYFSITEQRAIASILSALDDKIKLNRTMSATLEAIARALFKSWFVDFDPVRARAESRDPGLPAEIAALFPDSFEETVRGTIPSGWRVGVLGEVAKNKRNGISHNDITEGTPYIGLEHMPRRSIALDRWGHASQLESNKSEFHQGNMLFGKLRPYFHKVGIAPVGGVCSTDILVISATSAEWSAFVLMHLSSDALVAHTDRCSTGTKMPRASWDHICSYNVALPPIDIARMFTAAVAPMTDRIISGIHESRTLAALRDTLLPKLISGDLRVTDAKRIVSALA